VKHRLFLYGVDMHRYWFPIGQGIQSSVSILTGETKPPISLGNNTFSEAKLATNVTVVQLRIVFGFLNAFDR